MGESKPTYVRFFVFFFISVDDPTPTVTAASLSLSLTSDDEPGASLRGMDVTSEKTPACSVARRERGTRRAEVEDEEDEEGQDEGVEEEEQLAATGLTLTSDDAAATLIAEADARV